MTPPPSSHPTVRSPPSTFWLLFPPPSLFNRFGLYQFFMFPKLKVKQKRCRFDSIEEVWCPDGVTNTARQLLRNELPANVLAMKGALRTVYPCARELLQGWWWPVSAMMYFLLTYLIRLEIVLSHLGTLCNNSTHLCTVTIVETPTLS